VRTYAKVPHLFIYKFIYKPRTFIEV